MEQTLANRSLGLCCVIPGLKGETGVPRIYLADNFDPAAHNRRMKVKTIDAGRSNAPGRPQPRSEKGKKKKMHPHPLPHFCCNRMKLNRLHPR
jgi:hypothetical protein